MGSEWRGIQLGELVTLQRGHDLPSQDRRDGSVPIMGSSGLTGFHNAPKCKGPGVVVGRSGNSMGVVSYCDVDFWPLNTALYVTDFKGNDERYIFYLLSRINFDQFNSGSAQKSLNRNAVYPFEVWATTNKREQREIGQILEAYEHKIELNRQINITLEAMAQALFKSWFVDFDPVIDNALAAGNPIPPELAARAERRQQHHARANTSADAQATPYQPLPANIQQQFPDRFVFTEAMGWVPEGWALGSLSEVAKLQTQSVQPNNEPKKEWVHFSIPAFDESMCPAIDLGETIKSGKYRVPATSVLASKLNPQFPRIWMPDVDDEASSVCSTEFMPFVPLQVDERAFLYSFFCSDLMRSEITNRVTGSTGSRQRVRPKDIAELPILVYPRMIRSAFSSLVAPFFSKQAENRREVQSLSKIRDTLLPKLLSGQLRIPDAEAAVDKALAEA